MNLQLSYPFKPYMVTQKWGNKNDAYNQFGFTLHNGIDARASWSTSKWPVYCPVEGFRIHKVDYNPTGGGNEIWLISKEKIVMFERECYAYVVLCHADKVLVQAGYEPALGELLMVADNTGFSTGAHTHMGLYRVDYNGASLVFLDQNEANGSFDPSLFFTGLFAVDQATLPTLIKSNLRYYQYVLGLK